MISTQEMRLDQTSQETNFGVYYWRRVGTIGPIKIGKWSGSPIKTISKYEQRGDPRPAELLAVEYSGSHKEANRQEHLRKKQFAEFRIRSEWFNTNDELTQLIIDLAVGKEPIQITLKPLAPQKMDKSKIKVPALTAPSPQEAVSKRKEFRISGLRWPK